MWAAGLEPGDAFDARGVEPAFQALIATGTLPNGRAFVPGCGRGYAVAALTSAERKVTGLEISETAKAAADAYLSSATSGDGGAAADGAQVIVVSVLRHNLFSTRVLRPRSPPFSSPKLFLFSLSHVRVSRCSHFFASSNVRV